MPKRTDANHDEIRQAFRDRGFSWLDTFALGDGFPDGCIGKYGINCLIEVKDGSKFPSQRRLSDDELKLHSNFQGWIEVVESIADVISVSRKFDCVHEKNYA